LSVETVVSTGTAPLSCLDDLLNDWYAGYHPKFEGIRVHPLVTKGVRSAQFSCEELPPQG